MASATRGGWDLTPDNVDEVLRLSDTSRETPNGSDADDANAMASILAAYLDGGNIRLADLPLSARRRIVAYQHQRGAGRIGARGVDQHGPLPDVPPISAPNRPRGVTVIDVVALEDQP